MKAFVPVSVALCCVLSLVSAVPVWPDQHADPSFPVYYIDDDPSLPSYYDDDGGNDDNQIDNPYEGTGPYSQQQEWPMAPADYYAGDLPNAGLEPGQLAQLLCPEGGPSIWGQNLMVASGDDVRLGKRPVVSSGDYARDSAHQGLEPSQVAGGGRSIWGKPPRVPSDDDVRRGKRPTVSSGDNARDPAHRSVYADRVNADYADGNLPTDEATRFLNHVYESGRFDDPPPSFPSSRLADQKDYVTHLLVWRKMNPKVELSDCPDVLNDVRELIRDLEECLTRDAERLEYHNEKIAEALAQMAEGYHMPNMPDLTAEVEASKYRMNLRTVLLGNMRDLRDCEIGSFACRADKETS